MPQHDDVPSTDTSEIEALIARLEAGRLREDDAKTLARLLRTFLSLIHLLQRKNSSIARLKRLLFGPRSDTRADVATKPEPESADEPTPDEGAPSVEQPPSSDTTPQQTKSSAPKPKRPGHGRLPAEAYIGARVEHCVDPQIKAGAACPDVACRGRLYDTKAPAILIRLEGQPIVGATRYEQEVLRCSSCQERFTAPLPEGVPPQKYDATADVAIALAKYGGGIPAYRLEKMQAACGVPLPASVQFERCQVVADTLLPLYLQMQRLAANGEVLYVDDTRVRVLDLIKENKQLPEKARKGVQTSVVVAEVGTHFITLYFSGRRHAGENLQQLLERRIADTRPIQMADALAANWKLKAVAVEEAKCLAHARRQFTDIEQLHPAECGRVLEAIRKVYAIEAQTTEMTDEERLSYHQQHSAPVLRELKEWVDEQLAESRVEPNNSLGQALAYLRNHWPELTKFLSVAGCPLDNNRAERALKRVVLLRKNALFYKTEHGAAVGDIIASVIETCRLNGVNVWQYLCEVMNHREAVRKHPRAWLPWIYPRRGVQRKAA